MGTQQGMTIIRMLLLVIAMILLGITVMQIIPVYLQNYEIHSSIKALQQIDSADFSSEPLENTSLLHKRLLNQLSINGLNDIKSDQIKVVPGHKEGSYVVAVKYMVIKPFIYNISLMFEFNEAEEVNIGTK